MPSNLDQFLVLATQRLRPVSLRALYSIGNGCLGRNSLQVASQFLHEELPARFMESLRMLAHPSTPAYISNLPSVHDMSERIVGDLSALLETPRPVSPRDDASFTDLIRALQQNHAQTLGLLDQVFLELQEANSSVPRHSRRGARLSRETQAFFERFHKLQIGAGLLMSEQISLHDQGQNIVTKVSPRRIAQQAAEDARQALIEEFPHLISPQTPSVVITETSQKSLSNLVYLEDHLRRILFEIFKNSLLATARHQRPSTAAAAPLPPLRLTIAEGKEDITFKLSDEGGGIPFASLDRIWDCTQPSTHPGPSLDYLQARGRCAVPMLGLRHGLALSRIIARYFGGDLQVVSMDGYGTDTYLYLLKKDSQPEALEPTVQESLKSDLFPFPNQVVPVPQYARPAKPAPVAEDAYTKTGWLLDYLNSAGISLDHSLTEPL
ncbi:uncharacterized protein BJ171DRAFT_497176 [Polychytrium aggregatum]|uniref:uncharacterized protein n=1 Tax=Polychytrium aggregatum TaxID=110093 RepID=UPI0022FE88B3|nr:uncharacterized protein BJ171DRAFT_497176 [Polychytrium aggregatum]KAI9206285.1 hypothetical protein BJ171DRAFT_497176 [Polychytrium aggregatum]